MLSPFASLVSSTPIVGQLLPLAHTTDGYQFRDIIQDPRLRLSKCDVFNEQLIYLFYGRPAYRVATTKKATSLHAFSLISILFKPEALPIPKRVFPFDTGAWKRGHFAPFMHPGMTLANFEVAPSLKEAQRLVHLFYGDNEHYFTGEADTSRAFTVLQMEASSYRALIDAKQQTNEDDRRGSIEIQYSVELELTSSNVMAVVMPRPFWDDKDVAQFVCGVLRAEPLSYDTFHAKPAEDVRAIMGEVRKFLDAKGLV